MENPYPFQIMEWDQHFTILTALESDDIYEKYYSFFLKSTGMRATGTVGKDISSKYSNKRIKSY